MAQSQQNLVPEPKRSRSFQEVSLGYSKKVAFDEAQRCPQCGEPRCVVKGCPLGIDIPGFIRLLREGNLVAAYQKIKEHNPLPSVCGRICSAPCEAACILNEEKSPIGIRALERYASDYGKPRSGKSADKPSGKRIAVIGSGPSGLSAAYELVRSGFQVTVFEALERTGGVLRYGIPEYRLPNKVLDAEIQELKNLGVEFEMNFLIGQTATLSELKDQGYTVILLATGAGVPKMMDLPGSSLSGVYYGEEFLMRVNLAKHKPLSAPRPNFPVGQKVAVIGSGNTALDCARSARRFGCEVTIVFRRTEDDFMANPEDLRQAKEEGVKLEPLAKPLEVLSGAEASVNGLKCLRFDYADPHSVGKWELIPVPGSEFTLECQTVVIAIGHMPNALIARFQEDLHLSSNGTIAVDENGESSVPLIFACGNVVTNAGPVVEAIASGKKIAGQIKAHLMKGPS